MAKNATLLLSSWRHYFQAVDSSPQTILSAIEESIEKREIPDIKLKRVVRKEGGLFSSRREYVRVQRKEYFFDISVIPFGRGLIVSWYLREKIGFFWRMAFVFPALGVILIRLIRPDTFCRFDTAWAFENNIHSTVLETMNGQTQARGYRSFAEDDRKPIHSSFFGEEL